MTTTNYTVLMHRDIENQLDECFSPADGGTAIEQMYEELPKVHGPRRFWAFSSRHPRVFRGRFGWSDVGFSYVQIGDRLHVIDIWHDADWANPRRREVDAVLGNMTA